MSIEKDRDPTPRKGMFDLPCCSGKCLHYNRGSNDCDLVDLSRSVICQPVVAKMQQQIAEQQATIDELTAALVDMVNQHCSRGDGSLDANASSSNADAMRLLEALGTIKITGGIGQMIQGEFLPVAEAAKRR